MSAENGMRFEQMEIEWPDPGRIVRGLRRPIGVPRLAQIIGMSRFTMLRRIHAGLYLARNIGSVEHPRYVIDPAEAVRIYEMTLIDPYA